MKLNKLLKGKLMLALFLFIATTCILNANTTFIDYVGAPINSKAIDKVNEIGQEVQTKTNIQILVYARQNLFGFVDIPMEEKIKKIKSLEQNLTAHLKGEYALLVVSVDDVHVNLLMSDNVKSIINKDDILDDYVIPLLASKDKNSLNSKVSAAILNGYAEIADRIAESKQIVLTSSIGSGGTQASSIWKVFMYTMIVGGLLLYTYAIMRSKKNG